MEFRDLLAALNFEASYESTKRELTIRVVRLVPELTHPDGPRAPLFFVPSAFVPGREPNEKGRVITHSSVQLNAVYLMV